jgi:hypothetical protein
MSTTDHPYLDRIIQAEADRLSDQWGRSAIEPQPEKGRTLVFGLAGEDVQMGMTIVNHSSGEVER